MTRIQGNHRPLGWAAALYASSWLLACGGSAGMPTSKPREPATPERDAGAPEQSDTPAGRALSQVLAWMNDAPLEQADYLAAFDETFTAQVTFEAFDSILDQLRPAIPWQLEAIELLSDFALAARVTSPSTALKVELQVTAAPPHRIVGLLLQPGDAEPFTPPSDTAEALARLREQGQLSLLTAELANGACQPVREIEPERQRPLGSVFKLWVLRALEDAVSAGSLQWSTPVTIDDALDSLPSGTTQHEPHGSSLTVRTLAERMVAASDNTASDHLIQLVGRAAVEQAVVDAGHADPARNRPFLTTRELFILKFGAADLRDTYIAADMEARRALLEERVATEPLPSLAAVAEGLEAPRAIEQVEWFGSARDVCRVLVDLVTRKTSRALLARNPGLPAPASGPGYDYLGFKGGSEPGVLAAAWAFELDGQMRATIGLVSNAETTLDELHTLQLLGAVRDMTADEASTAGAGM